VLTQYATAKAGLILVSINPAYRVAELEYALNKVECRALITANRFKTSDYLGMLRELAPEIDTSTPGKLRAERLPHLRMLILIGDAQEPMHATRRPDYRVSTSLTTPQRLEPAAVAAATASASPGSFDT
jgi:fatty-acyl-CoA synthase